MFIAQLSDPHVTEGVLGAVPAARFRLALGRVLALDPWPDCVVVTGDLTDHGWPSEYQVFAEVLTNFPVPVHVVPGNHDDAEVLVAEFGGSSLLGGSGDCRYVQSYPQASVIGLNSAIPGGDPAGRLGPDQLAWLDDQLTNHADRPALLALHHPPARVGIPFLDAMNLLDADALAAVVARHPHVVRVMAGHVHRPVTATCGGVIVSVAPSTYRQSACRFVDAEPPGVIEEPTAFLLHFSDGGPWVSHQIAVSHAGGQLGYF